ncbi:MAG: hypothetical protein SV062_03535 [Thermodesulfobacteriota bacterium]|nr:hypothetical protein [Thermodesulfobacteriota bacterium]
MTDFILDKHQMGVCGRKKPSTLDFGRSRLMALRKVQRVVAL